MAGQAETALEDVQESQEYRFRSNFARAEEMFVGAWGLRRRPHFPRTNSPGRAWAEESSSHPRNAWYPEPLCMVILFAISMASFFALFAAAIAALRHVQRTAVEVAAPLPRRAATLYTFPDHSTPPQSERSITPPHQTVADISPRKTPDWGFMAPPSRTHRPWRPPVPTAAAATPARLARKGPHNSHFGRGERLDWAYFNKDLGDLRDPYQASGPPRPEPASEPIPVPIPRFGTR